MAKEIKHLWQGGPLREWSANKPSRGKWTGLAGGGFVGNYVCERCHRPVDGVYSLRGPQNAKATHPTWICGPCKDTLRATPVRSRWRVA